MYTSGSTGEPKGVEVTHRNIARLVDDPEYVELGPGTVMLHAASPAFDATTLELWGPLANGGADRDPPRAALARRGRGGDRAPRGDDPLADRRPLPRARRRPARVPRLESATCSPAATSSPRTTSSAPSRPCRPTAGSPTDTGRPRRRPSPSPTRCGPAGARPRRLDPARAADPGDHLRGPRPRPAAGADRRRGRALDRRRRRRPRLPRRPGADGRARSFPTRPGPALAAIAAATAPAGGPTATIEFLGRIDRQVKVRGVRVEPAEVEERAARPSRGRRRRGRSLRAGAGRPGAGRLPRRRRPRAQPGPAATCAGTRSRGCRRRWSPRPG